MVPLPQGACFVFGGYHPHAYAASRALLLHTHPATGPLQTKTKSNVSKRHCSDIREGRGEHTLRFGQEPRKDARAEAEEELQRKDHEGLGPNAGGAMPPRASLGSEGDRDKIAPSHAADTTESQHAFEDMHEADGEKTENGHTDLSPNSTLAS
eukprot:2806898-Pleurochrysis_carterae.AAC.1